MPSVDELNQLPEEAARQALGPVCSSGGWAGAVLAGRPYPDLAALLSASDAAVAALSEAELLAALAGHPRIGDRRVLAESAWGGGGWQGREQAGVGGAGDELRQALADGNEAYERRFGHIYLACATGRDAAGLLAFLRTRLANDRATEWRVVASELARINQLRLRVLLDGAS